MNPTGRLVVPVCGGSGHPEQPVLYLI